MKKILKLLKNNIIGIIIGGVIFGTIGIGATTMFASSDVIYDNTSSGASSTTVQGALDELYEVANLWSPIYIGRAVYYNPVTGNICDDYVPENSLNENTGATTDTECMKWYIINVYHDKLDMILDHNTTYSVVWNSSSSNDSGPNELLTQLKTDTNGWTGVETRSDTYTDPLKGYTINYSGYKARLIEANEVAEITGAADILQWNSGLPYGTNVGISAAWYHFGGTGTTYDGWQNESLALQGKKHFAWLFGYTSDCENYGCSISDSGTIGYWTSSASDWGSNLVSEVRAFEVSYAGVVNFLDFTTINVGLRPVITIDKSLLTS